MPVNRNQNTLAQDIVAGLEEAVAYVEGKPTGTRATVVQVPDVKAVRQGLGLSQQAFAETFCIPVGALRNWEQHRRTPDQTAAAYLTVIEKDPDAVKKALEPA